MIKPQVSEHQNPVKDSQGNHQSSSSTMKCSYLSGNFEKYDHIPDFNASSRSTYFSELKTYLVNYYNLFQCVNDKLQLTHLGAISEGTFADGLGYQVISQGVYTGHFVNSTFDGLGQMIFNNGDSYERYFTRNKYNGHGTFRQLAPPVVYTGEYLNHQQHGFGVYADENFAYAGDWIHNKKHGYGTMTNTRSGFNYTGGFQYDEMNGEGTLTFRDATFSGNFVNSKKNGRGHLQYREIGYEYEYIGMFENDQKHGWGYLNFSSKGFEFEGNHLYDSTPYIGRVRLANGTVLNTCLDPKYDHSELRVVNDNGDEHLVPAYTVKCQDFEVIMM